MSIAIATPTGHIGHVVADRLIAGDEPVVLLARDPSKVAEFVARGARVVKGSLEDEAYVIEATKGADALFWLTPPDVTVPDYRAYYNRLGANGAKAVRENGIGHVVHLSSMGAHRGSGHGPINGLHDIEIKFDDSGASVFHLRPAMFFENVLNSLETIKGAGSVFLPIRGDVRSPMIATKDIGEAAARVLADRTWSGHNVAGLHGPADLSFNEIAQTLTEVLGRPIAHVQVSPDQAFAALTGMGISEGVANTFIEMYTAFDDGSFEIAEKRTAQTTTPTTFREFAEQVVKPLVVG